MTRTPPPVPPCCGDCDGPLASKKTVTATSLKALGAARLGYLPVELAEADAGVKRRLRLERADAERRAP